MSDSTPVATRRATVLLRVSLGVMYLTHGLLLKVMTFGVATRYVSIALLPVLVGAFWVHSGNGWMFSNAGGGWEYPLFLIVLSVAVALLERGWLPARFAARDAARASGTAAA